MESVRGRGKAKGVKKTGKMRDRWKTEGWKGGPLAYPVEHRRIKNEEIFCNIA